MHRIAFLIMLPVLILACNGGSGSTPPGSSNGDNGGNNSDDPNLLDLTNNDGNNNEQTVLDGDIEPGEDSITVNGEATSVEFSLILDGKPAPNSNRLVWSVDDTRIGSISEDGVFRANGTVGGVVKVTASIGNSSVSTTLTVDVDITRNPGGLDETARTTLQDGGSGDANFEWLYPYDGTVFPRDVQAPVLQVSGTNADGLYLEIELPHFHYRQFDGAATPPQVILPPEIWRGLSLTANGGEDVNVEVTKRVGSAISGPIASTWKIAPASLKGIIYYSTYKSPLAGNEGAIMRILPGQAAEILRSNLGCTVCHTVSANGNVLASGEGFWAEGVAGPPDVAVPTDSATFDLDENGGIAERYRSTEGLLFAFAALTPDGSRALVNGAPPNTVPPDAPRAAIAPSSGFRSRLVDTATGTEINAPSLENLVTYAQAPVFSPDGTKLAFVDGDRLTPDQRILAVMNYDGSANPPMFSSKRDWVVETEVITRGTIQPSQGVKSIAWPSFLPDSEGIIYHSGGSYDSSEFNIDANGPAGPYHAELRLAQSDGTIKELGAVNGQGYLPYGAAQEGEMNYEPSVLPVAVGGYYWVLFTSRRAYGNTIAPNGVVDRGDDPWGTEANPSPRKKLWLAAIDVDYADQADPSHPAFYVPGQEIEAGNMRGYAALAPCKPNGSSCESGSDCCEGFCRETSRDTDGVPVLECIPPPDNECSQNDELCATAEDCCDLEALCINSRCTKRPIR